MNQAAQREISRARHTGEQRLTVEGILKNPFLTGATVVFLIFGFFLMTFVTSCRENHRVMRELTAPKASTSLQPTHPIETHE